MPLGSKSRSIPASRCSDYSRGRGRTTRAAGLQLHALPALSRRLPTIIWAVMDALESFFLMGGEGSVLGKDLPRKAAISGKCVNTI